MPWSSHIRMKYGLCVCLFGHGNFVRKRNCSNISVASTCFGNVDFFFFISFFGKFDANFDHNQQFERRSDFHL